MSKEINEVTGLVRLFTSPNKGMKPADGIIRAVTIITNEDEEYGFVKLRSRSRSQVRSRSGPRSGPKGPRTKDQRPGPGLYTKFGLPLTTHHSPTHPPLNFSCGDNHSKPLLYDF